MNIPQHVIEKMTQMYSKDKGKKCVVCGNSIRKFRGANTMSLKSAYSRRVCSIECNRYDRKSLDAMYKTSRMFDSLIYLQKRAAKIATEKERRNKVKALVNTIISTDNPMKPMSRRVKRQRTRQIPQYLLWINFRFFWKNIEFRPKIRRNGRLTIRDEILMNMDKWEKISYTDELKIIGSNHDYYNESELKIPQTPTITV